MGLESFSDKRYYCFEKLREHSGSFWEFYGDQLTTNAILRLAESCEWQILQDQEELLACGRYDTVPVFHTERWLPIVIRESQVTAQVLRFGEGAVFGPQADSGFVYQFGVAAPAALLRIDLPAGIKTIAMVSDGISSHTVSWLHGIDFEIRDSTLLLPYNPFDYEFDIQDVYEDGAIVDREIELWCYNAEADRQYLVDHVGFMLGIEGESTNLLREVTLATYEATVHGTTDEHIKRLVYGATGVATAKGNETVQIVRQEADALLIITDQEVYRFSPETTAIVSAGQALVAGQSLVSAVTFYDLSRGEVPTDLVCLALDQSLLSESYLDGLMFENKNVDLVAELVGSRTKVSFALGGFTKDVTLFWNEVHQRGLETSTLAELMDPRTTPATEPTAVNLPQRINPMQFLIENVLRFSAFVIKIKVTELAAGKDLRYLQLLRRIVPPWYLCIVILEVQITESPITMDGPGSESEPGFQESQEATYCNNLEDSVDGPTYVTDSISAHYTGFRCQ